MKIVSKSLLKVFAAIAVSFSLTACTDNIAIWDLSLASGDMNTQVSEFLNADTDAQKEKSLAEIRGIVNRQNIVWAGWNSVAGIMAMYYTDEMRSAAMNDYNQARDVLALSLLMSDTSYESYCKAVANCSKEDYEALIQRGRFVKNSLELSNPNLTARLALFQARYPAAEMSSISVYMVQELIFDDEKFIAFLTDDEAALGFIARDMEERDRYVERGEALSRLRPVDITITPALGS